MAVFSIESMKVVSPSPDNFILKLDLSDGEETKSYNFIASGEHVYAEKKSQSSSGINSKLLDNHVAHSSIFQVGGNQITAFSLFDMNDLAITTCDGINETDTIYLDNIIDNILLMPNANIAPKDRISSENLIPMHTINSNAVYGYIKTYDKSFGFPGYIKDNNSILHKKFFIKTHNQGATMKSNLSAGTSDTLTLYKPHNFATHISAILSLGVQADINSNQDGFDKLFVFDPTDNNRLVYQKYNVGNWRGYQSNTSWQLNQVTNNFDIGTLLARTILFPKQTLNNEYSTERKYVDNTQYGFVRKYNWNDDYFYSNGMDIVLNHKDSNKFTAISGFTGIKNSGTMVTSTYSKRFDGLTDIHLHDEPREPSKVQIQIDDYKTEDLPIDYNKYDLLHIGNSNLEVGIYNQYSPEIFNRKNETQSDTSLMSSLHKANLFDVQFSELWKSISDKFEEVSDYNTSKKAAYDSIRDNLKESIKSNLFKLVDEIKPVQTQLYRIKM